MFFGDKEFLTEQERVQVISAMWAIVKSVFDDHPNVLEDAENVQVPSIEIAKISGIDLEAVNASLENLDSDGIIHIDEIDIIDE